MKRRFVPVARAVDIVSDHACPACGGDRRGRGMGQPGLCDTCQAAAKAEKSRALRASKRPKAPR